MEKGWICPKCNNVYAPNNPICLYCLIKNIDTSQQILNNSLNISPEKINILENNTKEEKQEKEVQNFKENKKDTLINKQLIIEKVNIEIPSLNKEPIYPIPGKWPDTKIFLSGIGHSKERAINREFKIPYILDSVIDFPLQPSSLVRKYFDYIKSNNIEYLLDSGAFSYISNPKKTIKLKEYIDKYCYYINEFDIKDFFELDLDVILPIEEVENIRKKIFLETHKQPIIVYHESRGRNYWDKMCKENDFIAIGVPDAKDNSDLTNEILIEMCDKAHRYNTKVHGLGCAALTLLNSHTMFFDTVDSTSWNFSKRGYAAKINEKGELIKDTLPFYYTSIEAQEEDLKVWAQFITNYKGAARD